jgi:hypothetical protein
MKIKVSWKNSREVVRAGLFFTTFAFLFFGMWEWLQTPFYSDITNDINTIVWYRIHCTFGDILIILGAMILYSAVRRQISWFLSPSKIDLAIVTVMTVAYTLVSEYVNVHLRGAWGYSEWMPVFPGLNVGIMPVIQWLVLPTLVIHFTNNHQRGRKAMVEQRGEE